MFVQIIMSNNELPPIQNPKKDEAKPLSQPEDHYEQLMQEGKEVLDNIPQVHTIQEDAFLIQRKDEFEGINPPKRQLEGQGTQKRESEQREGEINGDGQSKAGPQGQSKNQAEHSLSMTKKTSRAFLSCNCIKSKCTKNYCECFTQGMSQSSLARKCSELCKCTGCENQGESEKKYRSPIEMEETERMCNCKKSNCLKKYCECFNSGVRCTSNCKCQECKNTLEDGMEVEYEGEEGREEQKKVRSQEQINQINAKIDQIARIVPQEQQEYVFAFLEYWLS